MQQCVYAHSALKIEKRDKVLLNIRVEVMEQLLEKLIEQYAGLPVARKEHAYKNFLEPQRSRTVRFKKLGKRSKTTLNSTTDAGAYPNLLGELELELRKPGVRRLRFFVGVLPQYLTILALGHKSAHLRRAYDTEHERLKDACAIDITEVISVMNQFIGEMFKIHRDKFMLSKKITTRFADK